eukprot:CAMPEP_0198296090 /NCGR_PEP_ID=MMETSP1449-20131203/30905_1 /TAXON_ID=420275 /ORGANISM="Attheya septentrionalis, Strain CCMP2084" /LENGTH=359 /DNA_ID=CAMNT_0043996597 /DNA_START=94 /DNA_END=1170 /DNA_ORIENTATION=+
MGTQDNNTSTGPPFESDVPVATAPNLALIRLAVRVQQVKLFHTKLAVLDSVSVAHRASCSIDKEERFFLHVQSGGNHQIELLPLCRDLVGEDNNTGTTQDGSHAIKSGRWIPAVSDRILVVRIDPTRPVERNRRGTRVIECNEIVPTSLEAHEDGLNNEDDDLWHETNDASNLSEKGERHEIFAAWLVETFGKEALQKGSGVLDVAGGNGELSSALTMLGIPSIVLDPKPRCRKESTFQVIPASLMGYENRVLTDEGEDTMTEGDLVSKCAMVVGMHPDQATEPIVDLSLRFNKPFSIIPCCVFPQLFPTRRQKRHGDPVRSYSAFCQYLLDKSPSSDTETPFQSHHLPFVGRNKVIYW